MNDHQRVIQEWLDKAERDFNLVQRLSLDIHESAPEHICFYAQQTVEKTIKALLILHKQKFRKIHHLAELARQAQVFVPDWEINSVQLDWLEEIGILSRYPGVNPSREEALQAFKIATEVRQTLLVYFQSTASS